MCPLTWQRGLSRFKDWGRGEISRWVQCDHKGLYKKEAGGSEGKRVEDTALLALKMEAGATSRGKQVACRGWEGPGRILP